VKKRDTVYKESLANSRSLNPKQLRVLGGKESLREGAKRVGGKKSVGAGEDRGRKEIADCYMNRGGGWRHEKMGSGEPPLRSYGKWNNGAGALLASGGGVVTKRPTKQELSRGWLGRAGCTN